MPKANRLVRLMLDFMKASDMSIASSTSLMSYTSSPVVEVS